MKKRLMILLLLTSPTLFAGKADVVDARVRCPDSCSFDISVGHADSGWDHYANQWDVIAPDGTVLATRVLYHPHENEQPFTRSLSGVNIPPNIDRVTIRAHDLLHGWGVLRYS